MNPAVATTTLAGVLGHTRLRRVVVVLSVTEITSWGILYYAFPVLASSITDDTGWDGTVVAAAFSLSQVVAGVLGIAVGRIIDRRGPRMVMTAGSALAVPAVLVIATAPTLGVFFLGWGLAGVAIAGVLYPPAFAALTHWGGPARIGALTTLTLVAGLASTVFAPLTAFVNSHLDWRDTYLVLVVVLAAVTIPLHYFGLRERWQANAPPDPRHPNTSARVWTTRPFLLLALSASAVAFTIYAVVINLVPLLVERGLSTGQAALALGLGGVGQVTGRLGYAAFAAHTGTVARTVVIFGGVALSTALLAVLPGPMFALFAVSMLVGVSRGIFTLLQATAITDRWGAQDYGRLNGILTAPLLTASAIAPFAGAAIAASTGSHAGAFLILAAIAAIATVAAPGTKPHPKGTNQS